jgi:hypothetical protein
MHNAVVIFLMAAVVFYGIGYNVPTIGLMVLGLVFEMLEWSTWIGASIKSGKNEDKQNK